MKKICSAALSGLLIVLLSFSVFAQDAEISTVVPSEHEIKVVYNEGGSVLYGGAVVPSGSVIEIGRFGDIRLDIIADKDAHLKQVLVNGEDRTDDMRYGQLTLNNVNTDIEIVFGFVRCDGSDTPEGEQPEPDTCVRMSMRGNVFRGEKLMTDGRLEFDLGASSVTVENGKYTLREIKDGYHQVVIFDENGEEIGREGFSIAVSDAVSEMKIERLANGTQLITVPKGTAEIQVDFIVNDDASITIRESEQEEEKEDVITDVIIPTTSAYLRENPLALVGVMVSFALLLLLIPICRRKREQEEAQQSE